MDDVDTLKEIANRLKINIPRIEKSSCILQISKLEHIVNIIIPIFNSIPLLTSKVQDFQCFEKAIATYLEIIEIEEKTKGTTPPRRIVRTFILVKNGTVN